ncbi:MAG: hypothetical protein OEY03_05110, partial [Rhizobacter sp.]|nr:hypothetical protein [Rhizobacter sp.]
MKRAVISAISGPVLHAAATRPFLVGEAVEVGVAKLPGEVIRLDGDTFVAQVYEDTTGLKPGDPVLGTGAPLSVALGPGLLGRIYDGLLRRLDVAVGAEDAGASTGQGDARVVFAPAVSVGDALAAGAPFGEVEGTALARACLVPPDRGGVVVSIAPRGEVAAGATVATLRDTAGREHVLQVGHR